MNSWTQVAKTEDFIENAGGCIKHGHEQIAIFNFGKKEWYAVQNQCPHKEQMVLARGLIGDKAGEPKVACPLHKNNFSLKTGAHLSGDGSENYCLKTYPIKVEDGAIFLELKSAQDSKAQASCQ